MLQVGNLIITICSSFFTCLSTNPFGGLYMDFSVVSVFSVFYTLGGKNKWFFTL